MKFTLLILLSIFFIACKPELDKRTKIALQAKEEAAQSEIYVKDLLLGFQFGMTPGEVEAHFQKLLEEGKIYMNHDFFTYNYETTAGPLKGNFRYEFFNNGLYEISLLLETDDLLLSMAPEIMLRAAKEVFDKKKDIYNFRQYSFRGPGQNTDTFYYIDRNLCISLSGFSTVHINYLNCPIDVLVKDSIKNATYQEVDKTSGDL